jgi:type I restriction enzyme S subunit
MSKYKRYERYKDSGVEWIGEIPEEWNVVRLKFLKAKPFLYGANETAELEEPELPRYIRITDIDSNGNLREDIFKSLPWEIAKPYLLKEGDILFARSGATVGKTFLYKKSWGVACFAGYLIKFEANTNKVIPKYVYYYTLSWQYENWVKQSTIQATIQNVSAEKYGNLLIPLPLVQQQKMIVDFLDQKTVEIDNLIADKEKLIELLQEKRQAIITEAVTKGLNPNVGMRDSGVEWIGEIPEHWNLRRIKYLANVRNVKAVDSDNDKTYIGLENIESRTGKLLLNRNDEQQLIGETANIFKKGDVLFGKLRPYLAKCIIADFDGRCTSELLVLRTTSYILPEYLCFLMLSTKFIDVVNSSTYGAKMPRASWDFIGNLQIPLPSIKEQEEIVEYLTEFISRIDGLITDINTQVQKLKEYCQSLISEAVTGKIDVRGYDVNN